MKTLIHIEGRFNPSCSKNHFTYTFYVPQGSSRLNIHFSYNPKELEDELKSKEIIIGNLERHTREPKEVIAANWKNYMPVKNLITVSLDDPEGFRGAAHRHDQEQHHIITKKTASAGFIYGDLKEGIWTLTVSAHAVVTDECTFFVRIWEGDEQ